MARTFISFAMEDKVLRDFLVGQKNNSMSRIDFIDYSVKEPWSSQWKTNCRVRIKGCAGMVGIVTQNTPRADGQLWELECALSEGIPLLLIHGYRDFTKRLSILPRPITGQRIHDWTEANIVSFLRGL